MDIRKLQRAIVDGLEDVKAQNIAIYDTEHLTPLFERVIIASGTSNRQTKALASSVRDTVRQRGLQVLGTEGEAGGEWIIVDCGAAVAHIMQPAVREHFHLEELWGGKTVRMKLGAAPAAAKKAAATKAPAQAPAKKAVATKAPAKRAAATKSAAKKAPAKKVAAKKVTAKKAPARTAAPARAAPKRASGTKTAPHKATPRKATPRKATPRKAAAGKRA
jgi:ribosome-associated protein